MNQQQHRTHPHFAEQEGRPDVEETFYPMDVAMDAELNIHIFLEIDGRLTPRSISRIDDALIINMGTRDLVVEHLPRGLPADDRPTFLWTTRHVPNPTGALPHPIPGRDRATISRRDGLIWWPQQITTTYDDLERRPIMKVLAGLGIRTMRIRCAIDACHQPVYLVETRPFGAIYPHEEFRIGPHHRLIDPAVLGLAPPTRGFSIPDDRGGITELIRGNQHLPLKVTNTWPIPQQQRQFTLPCHTTND